MNHELDAHTYPNKLKTVLAFDDLERLEEINTPDVGLRSYQYDELSNISQIKAEFGQFDYAYDRNSSLIGAYYRGSEALKDEKFFWDASGNRLNGTKDPSVNSVRPRPIVINNGLFEDAEPMSEQVGRFSFIYDMHGNVIKKFDNQENIFYVFEYDADNKLVYAEKYKNDFLLLKARYTYDGLGRRIEKEIIEGSIVSRKSYIYNGDNILLEYNTSGTTPVETARYIGTREIDDNLMSIKNGKPYFFHKDHLGSIVAITNDAGEVVQKNQYSSFGKILSIKNKERKEIGIDGATEKSFAYTGREWDKEIDLYYYRARHYDPQVGRFIQMDPIGLIGGDSNQYRYVENSPINYFDPYGWVKIKPGISDEQLAPVVKDIYAKIDQVTAKLNLPEAVVTSTNDSRHKKGSFHYVNMAIDLRGNNVSDIQMQAFTQELKSILGPDFDVISEFFPENPINDHIHIEYDPKQKEKPCP